MDDSGLALGYRGAMVFNSGWVVAASMDLMASSTALAVAYGFGSSTGGHRLDVAGRFDELLR